MALEVLAAAVLFVGLAAYAMFGGADFGGGFWTAVSFGPRASARREAIFRAMGPVWETNHVWLILVLVVLWTAFPPVFAAIFESLFLPLSVALLGIVFRGAAFAFRHYEYHPEAGLPVTGLVFSVASLITPLAMGTAVGAVANGTVTVGGPSQGMFEAWLHPFPLACGLIGVAICAFLTPFYMLVRTFGDLREDFRDMAVAGSLGLGGLTTLAMIIAAIWSSDFAGRLVHPGPLVFIAIAVALGLASLAVLWRRLYGLAPPVAAATIAAVLAAWAAAQYPYIVLPSTRISDVAATDATLEAFLIALPIGAVILIPSLFWLFSLFGSTPVDDISS